MRAPFKFDTHSIIEQIKNFDLRSLSPRKTVGYFLTSVGIMFGLFFIYLLFNLPSVRDLENTETNQASQIYSADGFLLGSMYRGENRIPVKIDQVPVFMQNALIVTEDVRFYQHSGIDIYGVVNIFLSALTGNARGGSTITQQLARNLYNEQVGTERTLLRKAKEAAAAVYLERQFTKSEILIHYFNTVPFGGEIYGVRAAAKHYFNLESPLELSPAQAALLVGMLKGSSKYNPVRNPEVTRLRRNTVIELMAKHNRISQRECEKIKSEPLDVIISERQGHIVGQAQHFRQYLQKWLKEKCDKGEISIIENGKQRPANLYGDGLRVYTTLDSRYQKHAEAAVVEHIAKHQQIFDKHLAAMGSRKPWLKDPTILQRAMNMSERRNVMKSAGYSDKEIEKAFNKKQKMKVFCWKQTKNGIIASSKDTTMSPKDSLIYYAQFLEPGMVTIDPTNGQIKAWVGGLDFEFFKYDHVMQGKRQVGSTFKPFVYTAAFDNGYSPCSTEPNEKITITDPGMTDPWTPENVDAVYGGTLTLRQALARSINVIAARVIKNVGPHEVVKYAQAMGIESKLEPYYSIALGTFDLSVAELTNAYATIAAGGAWHEPIFITRIEDRSGNVIYRPRFNSRRALDERTAWVMTDVLETVVNHGTAANLKWQFNVPPAIHIAGKTGTTQNNSDGWFVGFTPYYATGVWVGCADRSVNFGPYSAYGQGGYMAMPIFAIYTRKLYEDKAIALNKMQTFKRPVQPPKVEMDCSKYVEEPDAQPQTPEPYDDPNQSKMDYD